MRGSAFRSRQRDHAQPMSLEAPPPSDPLQALLVLNGSAGFNSKRIPSSAQGGTSRQRPSSAKVGTGLGSSHPFPEGMMGIIGQSKAVSEMQSAVRSVGLKRPASASIGGRSSIHAVQGGFGSSNNVALTVGVVPLQAVHAAQAEPGNSPEDYIPVKKLGQGASGVVYLVKLRVPRVGEQEQMYVMKQVEIGKQRGISAPSSERFSAIARHERDGALREVRPRLR